MENNSMEIKKLSQETQTIDLYANKQEMSNNPVNLNEQNMSNMNQVKTNLVEEVEASNPEAQKIMRELELFSPVTITREELETKTDSDIKLAAFDYDKLKNEPLDGLAKYALAQAKVEGTGDGFLSVVEPLLTVSKCYKNVSNFDGPEQIKANRASFREALINMRNAAYSFYDSKTFFFRFRRKGRARLALCKILKSDDFFTKMLAKVDNRLLEFADNAEVRASKRTNANELISENYSEKSEEFTQEAFKLYNGRVLEYEKYSKLNPAIGEAEKKYADISHYKRQPFQQLFKSTVGVSDEEAEANKLWNEKVNNALTELNKGNTDELYSVFDKMVDEVISINLSDDMYTEDYIINHPSFLFTVYNATSFFGDITNTGNFKPGITDYFKKLETECPGKNKNFVAKGRVLYDLHMYYRQILGDKYGIDTKGLSTKDIRNVYKGMKQDVMNGRTVDEIEDEKSNLQELREMIKEKMQLCNAEFFNYTSNPEVSDTLRQEIMSACFNADISEKAELFGDGKLTLDKLKKILPSYKMLNQDTVFFMSRMDDRKRLLNRYIGEGGPLKKKYDERINLAKKKDSNLPVIDSDRTIGSFLKPVHLDKNNNYLSKQDETADIWNKEFIDAVLTARENDYSKLKEYTLSIMDEYLDKGYSLDMLDYDNYKENYETVGRQITRGMCVIDNLLYHFDFMKKDIMENNPIQFALADQCSLLNVAFSNCISKYVAIKTGVETDSTMNPVNLSLKDKGGYESFKYMYNGLFVPEVIERAGIFKTNLEGIYSQIDSNKTMSNEEKDRQRKVLDKLYAQAKEIEAGIKTKTDELSKQIEEFGKIY